LHSLKTQVNDNEGLGGKISADDKEKVLKEIKEKISWLDSNPEATKEDIDEKQAEAEAVINPITTKAYQGGAEEKEPEDHSEL
jgi:heat shock protein 5